MSDHGLGALQTPADRLAGAWPIGLALAAAPIPAPPKYHHPKCDAHATLDQNGYGACVCASGDYIQSGLDAIDPAHLAWLKMYAILKGLPYPFTPKQDTHPGLNPEQLWHYTKANGWPTTDGSAPHKDADYFMVGRPSNSAAFLDALQQTILQFGSCQFTVAWPTNWYHTDDMGYMPTPGALNGAGHAIEACGWLPCPDGGCLADYWCHQTWGAWGHDPELPNHFRIHGRYLDALGWEAWKVADLVTPTPTPTPIPTPTPPEANMDVTRITPLEHVDMAPGGSLRDALGAVNTAKYAGALGVGTWGKLGADNVVRVQFSVGGPIAPALYPSALCTLIVPAPSFTQADIDKAVAAEKAKAVAAVQAI